MFQRLFNCKKGAALLEYSLLAAGVSLVAAAGVSVFGHKTSDMIGAVASIMPGAHTDDNGPITSGKIIETTDGGAGPIGINIGAGESAPGAGDGTGILGAAGTNRLGNNLGLAGLDTLVLEAE